MAAPNGDVAPVRRKRKNRQNKLHLLFDEAKRKDFLCGFKKRKDERKRKGREELERKIKEEKKQLLKERKEMLLDMFQQQRTIPEVESIVEPVTYDLQSHIVTITSINDVDFQGKNNLLIGENNDCEEQSNEGENEDTNTAELVTKCSAKLFKDKSKKVTPSKTLKMKQKLQQQKAQRKVKKKKKILRKRDKHRSRHVPKI